MNYELIISAVLALVNGFVLYSLARKDKAGDAKKEEIKNLDARVRILESKHVTAEQVKELLREKVDPLENSIKMLERDMRESHKDLARELRETNQEVTQSVFELHNTVTQTLNELVGTIQFIKGKLEARRDGD